LRRSVYRHRVVSISVVAFNGPQHTRLPKSSTFAERALPLSRFPLVILVEHLIDVALLVRIFFIGRVASRTASKVIDVLTPNPFRKSFSAGFYQTAMGIIGSQAVALFSGAQAEDG